jgi:hypothetical protein
MSSEDVINDSHECKMNYIYVCLLLLYKSIVKIHVLFKLMHVYINLFNKLQIIVELI